MEFDYFYKEQSDQFAFYRIPKVLITEDFFQELSIDAKLYMVCSWIVCHFHQIVDGLMKRAGCM